jgi:hypothetical protein
MSASSEARTVSASRQAPPVAPALAAAMLAPVLSEVSIIPPGKTIASAMKVDLGARLTRHICIPNVQSTGTNEGSGEGIRVSAAGLLGF